MATIGRHLHPLITVIRHYKDPGPAVPWLMVTAAVILQPRLEQTILMVIDDRPAIVLRLSFHQTNPIIGTHSFTW